MIGLVFCQCRIEVADIVTALDLGLVHLFLQVIKHVLRLIEDFLFDHFYSVPNSSVHISKQRELFKNVLLQSLHLHIKAIYVHPGHG